MSQNTSHAVMAQRHEAHDSLDFFPTPPWATRALCERLERWFGPLSVMTAWEPACGIGTMARPLAEYFRFVKTSDVHDYSAAYPDQGAVIDFLFPDSAPPSVKANGVDWIITNPPFRLAQQFIATARQYARFGVSMLVRTSFLEGCQRYKELFAVTPPRMVLQYAERVPMVKGRLDKDASTATSYCWLVWADGFPCTGTFFEWIAPCRASLERPGDYDAPEGLAALDRGTLAGETTIPGVTNQ